MYHIQLSVSFVMTLTVWSVRIDIMFDFMANIVFLAP